MGREDYDAAIAEGRTASIAEQERSDVFSLRVGNIPPRATARIELTLIAPLTVDFLEATYRFPLVVAPRYCPGVALDGEGVGDGIVADTDLVPDASRISPPVLLPGFRSPVRLGIQVRIAAGSLAAAAGRTAGSVGCTLPATEDVGDDGSLTVTVEPGQRLDRDLIVRFGIAADKVATSVLHVEPDTMRPAGLGSGKACQEAPGDGTFSLVIVPPAQEGAVKQSPRDVVFLLDRSGSMGDWKIAAARRAVARMIDTLTAADRVAVLAFDHVIEHCGTTARLDAATDRHRWRLLEWLAGVEARGGTELATALAAGLGMFGESGTSPAAEAPHARRDRLFVLVTDCQVGDEDRVVAGLVKGLGDVSFFIVGIDTAVNEGLLSRMADSTGGMVEMVESEERLDEVMDRIHRRLATPLVSSLAIHAAGLEIIPESLVPARLPDLVPGVPCVVRGRYRGRPGGGVRIEGRRAAGGLWQEQVEATPASNGCQGNLWARGRLRHLEDVYAVNDSVDAWTSLEKRLVELSTAFGVLCRFTAVVAIDQRQPDRVATPGAMRRVVQPVETAWPALRVTQTHSLTRSPCSMSLSPMHDSTSYDFLDFGCFEGDAADGSTPLDDARAEAARILAKIRPRSGKISGHTVRRAKTLLEAVRQLLESLAAADAPRQTIESLAAAHARLSAMPRDRAAFVALLDALAGIALLPDAADHWWRESAGRPKSHDDVPF